MTGRDRDNRSARDAAIVLPFLALFLLVEPVILIFAAPVAVAGVPLIVLYLFGAWGMIVLCAFLVARRLAPAPDPDPDKRPADPDGRA